MSRRDFATLIGVGAVTAAGLVTSPTPALADKTVQSQKRSFERYYPRIAAGGDTLRSVGDMLGQGDVAGAKEAVEAKEFDIKFRRALNIYATSFSDSALNKQSQELLYCSERLFNELETLKKAEKITNEVLEHYTIATEAYGKCKLFTPSLPLFLTKCRCENCAPSERPFGWISQVVEPHQFVNNNKVYHVESYLLTAR